MAALSVCAHHASNPRRAPGRSETEIRDVIVRRVVHDLARPVSALSASLPPDGVAPSTACGARSPAGRPGRWVTLRWARRAGET
jgi:hypothetical protein